MGHKRGKGKRKSQHTVQEGRKLPKRYDGDEGPKLTSKGRPITQTDARNTGARNNGSQPAAGARRR